MFLYNSRFCTIYVPITIHVPIQSIFLYNPCSYTIHVSIKSMSYTIHVPIQSLILLYNLCPLQFIFVYNPGSIKIQVPLQSMFLYNPWSYTICVPIQSIFFIQSIFLSNHCFNIIPFSLQSIILSNSSHAIQSLLLFSPFFSSIHISIKSTIFSNSYFSLIYVSIVISVALAYQQFYDFYIYNSWMVYQDGIIQHTSLVSGFSPRLDKLSVFNPVLIFLNFIWTSLFNPSSLIQSLKWVYNWFKDWDSP